MLCRDIHSCLMVFDIKVVEENIIHRAKMEQNTTWMCDDKSKEPSYIHQQFKCSAIRLSYQHV